MTTSAGGRSRRRGRTALRWFGALAIALLNQATIAQADPTGAHVVQPGDTLSGIASTYGTSTDALVAANRIADPNHLVIGQELVVPGKPAPVAAGAKEHHVVQPGETLIGIATTYDVALDQLRQANGLLGSDLIRPGDELIIPGRAVPTSRGAGPAHPPATSRYVVVPGDTLSGIASRLGVPEAELIRANGLADPNRLQPGDELIVDGEAEAAAPAPSGRQHVVQPGETLLRIAAAFGVSVGDLVAVNKLSDQNRIRAGQTLLLPAGARPVPAAAPAPAPAPQPAAPPPPAPAARPAPSPTVGDWVDAKITYYCMTGRMSNGKPVHPGAAAADRSVFPLGTVVEVEGIGTFTIEDRFGADLGQQRIDIWTADCGEARRFGVQTRRIRVVESPS